VDCPRRTRPVTPSSSTASPAPGCTPQGHHFPLRNRLVAALAAGTVVVEAGIRSGTFSTVHRTRELGRPVMAVPGPVSSAQSAGCHHLLQRADVRLVTCVEDILDTIGTPAEQPEAPHR